MKASRSLFIIVLLTCTAQLFLARNSSATQIDVAGPIGSRNFGTGVAVLPNGNFVVTDPSYGSSVEGSSLGRVCLYDGATLARINIMTGTANFDSLGNGGITVLPNGDFVVRSNNWNLNRGAITRCSATTGCPGNVSAENSLVGSNPGDTIGSSGVDVLSNGNYVVRSVKWNNYRGAITWCDGDLGCTGEISAANSRVGGSPSDRIGDYPIVVLTNGNYVAGSYSWDGNGASNAGAVTFCKGNEPCTGLVSMTNSLVGGMSAHVGSGGTILSLTNGNYVARTSISHNGQTVSAVTFCNGISGCHEPVAESNSLFPSVPDYPANDIGIAALPNGDYVVASPLWDNGSTTDVGAATFCSGTTGCVGFEISASNSLVGSTAGDNVSRGKIIALTNGGYVVNSPYWDNPGTSGTDVGASTFCGNANGCAGLVSVDNSLVGASPNDRVGTSAVALANGNYVAISPQWSNARTGGPGAGAVTFCPGQTGCAGNVTPHNSLVGSSSDDNVGTVAALTNGNYVVTTIGWNNGSIEDVGAATFCNGTSGCTGAVSPGNSLIGSTAGDQIGGDRFAASSSPYNLVTALPLARGNYVVVSPRWDSGSVPDVGALTTCSGTVGCTGIVSSANSLVGSTANDLIGEQILGPYHYGDLTALPNGDYILRTFAWQNMGLPVGAVTYGFGNGGTVGPVKRVNSVLGTLSGEGGTMNFSLDPTRNRLVVGRPGHNAVTLFMPDGIPEPISVVSRKVHGAAGAFDVDVLHSEIECRNTGAGGSYQVIVTFPDPVSVGGVSVTSSDGNATATQNTNGAVVTVDLSTVTNAQTLKFTLVKVNDGVGSGDVVIPFKVLTCDVFGDGFVTTFDLSQTTMTLGQLVNGSNFRGDVTASGLINATDIALVKSRLGTHLP